MDKTFRSAKQLHDELLARIARAGTARAEAVAKYGDSHDLTIAYLVGVLRYGLPELATALANAAGMEYLNESFVGDAK